MAAFELNDSINHQSFGRANAFEGLGERNNNIDEFVESRPQRRLKEENIICHKLYDVCRSQDCLTPFEIGVPRAAEPIITPSGTTINIGDIIVPPTNAASVSIDDLIIKSIMIISKTPNCFKKGFWDIDLKYVFEYRLTFRAADGAILETALANSIFNTKLCLFGSESCDLFIATDLLPGGFGMNQTAPFAQVEAKAIALSADLRFDCCCEGFNDLGRPVMVEVTIGLFSIVKLFRIVDLSVESRGFTIPEECDEISPMDPCEFFEKLDFPMDLFAPPQKPEFFAGISSNIKASPRFKKDCDCEQENDFGCSK